MSQEEGCGCRDCRVEASPLPPYALSCGSSSSEVGGHSGDSFREASGFCDLTDGEKEAFRASRSRASEVRDDWADGAPRRHGLSEAFLSSGRKVSEGWDDWAGSAPVASKSITIPRPSAVANDWADGMPPKSTAIPRALAAASAQVEWDWGGETSDSMSIPPSSAVVNVTLADGGRALDCRACCLPLKPPIFQCDQGHAVCLPCLKTHLSWEGSGAAARCNFSGGHDTDGYRQNKPLEDAVAAIRVPCPNAAYGCDGLLTRYSLPTHRRSCYYAPKASCPRDACRFAGSAEALLDHFISEEKWPYTAEDQAGKSLDISLWGGFNVVGAVRGTRQHLLVLYVARRPFGSTLSAICICPQLDFILWSRPPPEALKCKLELHFPATRNPPQTSEYQVRTSFDVPCTNPVNGFPNPDDFFQFFVPKSVHSNDSAAIGVTASITIE